MIEKSRVLRSKTKYVLLRLILLVILIITVNIPCSDILGQSEEPEFWAIILGVLGTSGDDGFTDQCADTAKELAQVLRPVYGDNHTYYEMVRWYTRSITFQDSLKFYMAPLG
jgi:hypothetical protein